MLSTAAVWLCAGAQQRLHEVWAQLDAARTEAEHRKKELAATQVNLLAFLTSGPWP